MTPRFALYYVPSGGSPLDDFGRNWFGRDAAGRAVPRRLTLPSVTSERLGHLIDGPRRYGLHATLAAPMRLADGRTPAALLRATRAFARGHTAVMVPPLRLGVVDRFLALVLESPSPAIEGLAAAAVTAFAPYRAPASSDELVRRRAAGLTARQELLLQLWGYPFVMEEFRFHLTLTDRVDRDDERLDLIVALTPLVAKVCGMPLAVDHIAVCRQDGDDAPFRLLKRFPLGSDPVTGVDDAPPLS